MKGTRVTSTIALLATLSVGCAPGLRAQDSGPQGSWRDDVVAETVRTIWVILDRDARVPDRMAEARLADLGSPALASFCAVLWKESSALKVRPGE